MNQIQKFKLIDGHFEPTEARSVLFSLVSNKINFHNMQAFGITVRSSGDTSFHDMRIKELAQTNIDIKKVMDYATENNLSLKINGTIEIELINES